MSQTPKPHTELFLQLQAAFGSPKKFKVYRKLLARYLTAESTFEADIRKTRILQLLVESDETNDGIQNEIENSSDFPKSTSVLDLHNRFMLSLLSDTSNERIDGNNRRQRDMENESHDHDQLLLDPSFDEDKPFLPRPQFVNNQDEEAKRKLKSQISAKGISSSDGRPLAQWLVEVCEIAEVDHFVNTNRARKLALRNSNNNNSFEDCAEIIDSRAAWGKMEKILVDAAQNCIRQKLSGMKSRGKKEGV